MACKACHKPKLLRPVVGKRYSGPCGDYIFSSVSGDKYAFVNLESGSTWDGSKSYEDSMKNMTLFKELRRN